jgi:hypothetical protein
MAGTEDDHSEELLLLRDVRALVAEHCKHLSVAEQLILEFAHKGHFNRYSWHEMEPGRGIDPRAWGKVFDGVEYPVIWEESRVCFILTKPDPLGSGRAVLNLLQDFLPAKSSFCISLVRLPRVDVLAMLHELRLRPRPKAPKPAEMSAPRPAPGPSVKQSQQSSEPKTWVANAKQRRKRGETVASWAKRMRVEMVKELGEENALTEGSLERRFYDKES